MRITNSVYNSFWITAVLMSLSLFVCYVLMEQDRNANFISPTKEFIDLTNEKIESLTYPVLSIESFYQSSSDVSEEEFSNFTSLIFQEYISISAIYFFESNDSINTTIQSDIKPKYWQMSEVNLKLDFASFQHDMYANLPDHLSPSKPITTDVFSIDNHQYIGIFLKMDNNNGLLFYLVNLRRVFRAVLSNDVSKDFFVADQIGGEEYVFYKNVDNSKISNDSLSDDLFFFDKTWLVTINRPQNYAKFVYFLVPIFSLLLSILLVYLFKYASRLAKLHREKSQALLDLQFAQEKIIEAEKINAMGGLVAGISHEVNTPLGVCITSTSHLQGLLKELKLDFDNGILDSDKFEDFLASSLDLTDLAMKNMQRTSRLVASFKRVSVINADDSTDIEYINVTLLIREFVEVYKTKSDSKKIKFLLDLPESAEVNTYPAVITQILSYLTSNTLIHGFRPGTSQCEIVISLTQKENDFILNYKDKGVGVAASNLKNIFEPFYTTKRGAGNAGLGLSVVYNLVKSKLESEIDYGSEEGEGLWYSIVLRNLK